MSHLDANKRLILDFIEAVWNAGNLDALAGFWTPDCVNHAMQGRDNTGLVALRAYHAQFLDTFAAFSNVRTEVLLQVAEGDRVVTHLVSRGRQSGSFLGMPPTLREVSLPAIRIDRVQDGRIAEHWSVSDLAGLIQQLQL